MGEALAKVFFLVAFAKYQFHFILRGALLKDLVEEEVEEEDLAFAELVLPQVHSL